MKTPKKQGRPAMPPEQAQTAMIRERVTPEQRQKYEARGGKAWLVAALNRERKQIKTVLQDAERYRWLRDSQHNSKALRALLDGVPSVVGGQNEFDAAIDAAMLKTPNYN